MSAEGGVLITGGGTAGHVNPALATALALRAVAPELPIAFVGTARGLEARLVPRAGWDFHEVRAVPLRRSLSPRNVLVPFVLAAAARRVARLLRAEQVRAAVAFGGYTSAPLALAARLTGTPLVIHEQNAIPGLANRWAARWAVKVATGVPGSARRFRRPERVLFTGNPVRPELAGVDRQALRPQALGEFGLEPGRRTLLVFGGSQGARRLNEALLESVGHWEHPTRVQVLHAAGTRDHEWVQASWAQRSPRPLLVRALPYIERMDLAYGAADLVLARAGASTIAELAVTGLPSILVPLPHAAADEQAANAAVFVRARAALLVPDGELTPERLVREAEPLLLDDERRRGMGVAARQLGHPDAARRVAQVVLDAAALAPDGDVNMRERGDGDPP